MFTEIAHCWEGKVFLIGHKSSRGNGVAVASPETEVQNGTEADGKDFRVATFLQSLDSMGF